MFSSSIHLPANDKQQNFILFSDQDFKAASISILHKVKMSTLEQRGKKTEIMGREMETIF
jgi:hypothetical protein